VWASQYMNLRHQAIASHGQWLGDALLNSELRHDIMAKLLRASRFYATTPNTPVSAATTKSRNSFASIGRAYR